MASNLPLLLLFGILLFCQVASVALNQPQQSQNLVKPQKLDTRLIEGLKRLNDLNGQKVPSESLSSIQNEKGHGKVKQLDSASVKKSNEASLAKAEGSVMPQKLFMDKSNLLETKTKSNKYNLFTVMGDLVEAYSSYSICSEDCENSLDLLSNYQESISSMIDDIDDLMADQSLIVMNMLQPVYESYEDLQTELDIEGDEAQSNYDDISAQSAIETKTYSEVIEALEGVGDLVEEILEALVTYIEGSSNLLETEAKGGPSLVEIDMKTTKSFFKGKIDKVMPKLIEMNQKAKIPLMFDSISLLKGLLSIDWEEDSEALVNMLTMIEDNLSTVTSEYQILEEELVEKFDSMGSLLSQSLQDIQADLSTLDINMSLVLNEIEMYETSIGLCEEFMEMMSMSMDSVSTLGEFLDSAIYDIDFQVSEELTSAESSFDYLSADTDMAQYIYDLLY